MTPIKLKDFENQTPKVDMWFQIANRQLGVLHGTTNPAVSMIPMGTWIIYTNTTLGETRIWTNIGGTLKSSAAFT